MSKVKSPFKFLDAYNKNDRDIFFGRDSEIDLLYEFVFKTNLLLIYGQSGTGKTSLVKCGLVNKFKETDWFDIHIRRKNNINDTLDEELRKAAKTPFDASFTLAEKLESIFLDYFKPIYLIFDQFEELYILGTEEERNQFIQNVKDIIHLGVKTTVIIVIREEYLANLYDFEKQVPELFDKRLRVEPMNFANVGTVIKESTEKFNIRLEDPEKTIPEIIENISDHKSGIQLSYLQIYLDRLFRSAIKKEKSPDQNGYVTSFNSALVQEVGSIHQVLADFLDNQTKNIQHQLEKEFPKISPQAVQSILNAFATLDGTKKPLKKSEIQISNLKTTHIESCLIQLEKARILRLVEDHYELAHDTIAKHISEQRDGDEVALLEVAKLIQDRYDVFNRTKTLLNPRELTLIANYETRLQNQNKLNPQLLNFIKKSRASHRRKRRLRFFLYSIIVLILASTTLWALIEQKKSKDAYVELEKEEKRNQDERIKAYSEYSQSNKNGERAMETADFGAAQAHFEQAILIAEKYNIDDNGQLAKDGLKESKVKNENIVQYNLLLSEGDRLFDAGDTRWVDALQKYREASEYGIHYDLTNEKIKKIEQLLPEAFERFKSNGLKHMRVQGYQYALSEFRQAQRIKPDDQQIRKYINECLSGIKKSNG